jgi:hypothetical protein
VKAFEITANSRYGKRAGAWIEMEQRFLFDRVCMPGYDFPIDEGIENAIPVFPDSADASHASRYRAILAAEMTLHFSVAGLLVKQSFLRVIFIHFVVHSSFSNPAVLNQIRADIA